MDRPGGLPYCMFAVIAVEAPTEFESVTVTPPIAEMSPEIPNGIEMVNWLPNAVDAALVYHVWNVFERSTL